VVEVAQVEGFEALSSGRKTDGFLPRDFAREDPVSIGVLELGFQGDFLPGGNQDLGKWVNKLVIHQGRLVAIQYPYYA